MYKNMASKMDGLRRTAREKVNEVIEKYMLYVQSNPEKIGQIETSVRIVSYLIAGTVFV